MVDEWHLLPGPADITKLDRIINKLAGKGKSDTVIVFSNLCYLFFSSFVLQISHHTYTKCND